MTTIHQEFLNGLSYAVKLARREERIIKNTAADPAMEGGAASVRERLEEIYQRKLHQFEQQEE